MTPDYFHAVMAHLLVLGLGLGGGALGWACWLGSREAKQVALGLVFLCSGAVLPVYWAGKEAYGKIRGMADEQGVAWLDLHLERGEWVLWGYLLLAGVSGVALWANRRRWHSQGRWLGGAALLIPLVLAAGIWTAQAGGRVRHPEFRPAEPLVLEEEEAYEVE